MPDILPFLPRFLEGFGLTVQITVASALGAAVVALILGLCRQAPVRWVRGTAGAIVEFFRGTSAIVQLFWAFFVLPLMFDGNFGPFPLAVAVISLNVGSFGAEIVRGALQAIPQGQIDAAVAANFSALKRLKSVSLPQALPLMIPPFGNLVIDIMKGSAVVGFLTLHDLTFWAEQTRVATGQTVPSYTVALLLYFAFALLISQGFRVLEAMTPLRRIEHRVGKDERPRGWGDGREGVLLPAPEVSHQNMRAGAQ